MKPLIAVLANLQITGGGDFDTRAVANVGYLDAVTTAGGVPFIVPPLDDLNALATLLDRADGLLITGGPDVSPNFYGEAPHGALSAVVPARDRLDQLTFAYWSRRPDWPALGICRGVQAMAVFQGASLIQDIPSQVPEAIQHGQKSPGYFGSHELTIEPDTLFQQIVGSGRIMTNSFHHQAVRQVPAGWIVAARTADGVIEAMEDPRVPFCLGVQFHPELMAPHHPPMASFFTHLVEAAARCAT